MSTKPITSRPIDLLYLIFFATHIPVILLNDIVPLYPSSIKTSPISSFFLTDYYTATYADRLFLDPPAWFTLYQILEGVLQIPLCAWLVSALVRGDARVPAGLLGFAVLCCVTTATCLSDLWTWDGYTPEQRRALGGLYVPYLVLGLLMGYDAFTRLSKALRLAETLQLARKVE